MSVNPAAPAPAGPAAPAGRRPLGRTVVALAVVSLLTDLSSEMIYPLLPLFLTTTLGAGAATLGAIEGAAETTAALTLVTGGADDADAMAGFRSTPPVLAPAPARRGRAQRAERTRHDEKITLYITSY